MAKDRRNSYVKRITAVLCCMSVAICGLCGCFEDSVGSHDLTDGSTEGGEVTNVKVEWDTAESETGLEEEPMEEPSRKILSPESAVDIYMANKDAWMELPEYMPMNGYGYCLLDLDLDGTLELISSFCDGTIRFSTNRYFKINPETGKVEEIKQENEGHAGYDHYHMPSDRTMLLKNSSSGKAFYICADLTRVSGIEFGTEVGKVYTENGLICTESVFLEYTLKEDAGSPSDTDYVEYEVWDGDEYVEVSKDEYDKKEQEFFSENQSLNLSWGRINGDEFDKSDAGTQRQLLLDAYRAFSYDGFSFDSVETYDLP